MFVLCVRACVYTHTHTHTYTHTHTCKHTEVHKLTKEYEPEGWGGNNIFDRWRDSTPSTPENFSKSQECNIQKKSDTFTQDSNGMCACECKCVCVYDVWVRERIKAQPCICGVRACYSLSLSLSLSLSFTHTFLVLHVATLKAKCFIG